MSKEVLELLSQYGGWAVAMLFSLAIKQLYTDQKELNRSHALEKHELFKMIVGMSEELSSVLSDNTEQSRSLAATLSEIRGRLAAPDTKQGPHRLKSAKEDRKGEET